MMVDDDDDDDDDDFFSKNDFFSPKDENLGVLKSTVYSCVCEGEPVWEHVVGGGREPAGSAGSAEIGPWYATSIRDLYPSFKCDF